MLTKYSLKPITIVSFRSLLTLLAKVALIKRYLFAFVSTKASFVVRESLLNATKYILVKGLLLRH